jgi:hypothetical protein
MGNVPHSTLNFSLKKYVKYDIIFEVKITAFFGLCIISAMPLRK